MEERVYKICRAGDWEAAVRDGAFRGSPLDVRDGFVHLSFASQVEETCRRHFAGEANLTLVTFETRLLGERLKLEPSRNGELFPHYYGELDVRWALEVRRIGESEVAGNRSGAQVP